MRRTRGRASARSTNPAPRLVRRRSMRATGRASLPTASSPSGSWTHSCDRARVVLEGAAGRRIPRRGRRQRHAILPLLSAHRESGFFERAGEEMLTQGEQRILPGRRARSRNDAGIRRRSSTTSSRANRRRRPRPAAALRAVSKGNDVRRLPALRADRRGRRPHPAPGRDFRTLCGGSALNR